MLKEEAERREKVNRVSVHKDRLNVQYALGMSMHLYGFGCSV